MTHQSNSISGLRPGGLRFYGVSRDLIDSWESQSTSAYSGDTASMSFSTSGAKDGDTLMQLDTGGSSSVVGSSSGLEAYPEQGYTMEIWVNPENQDMSIQWAKSDVTNKDDFNTIASASVSTGSNEWIRNTVEWGSDGTITYTVEDVDGNVLASASATDTTYTGGGVAWIRSESDGDSVYADSAALK